MYRRVMEEWLMIVCRDGDVQVATLVTFWVVMVVCGRRKKVAYNYRSWCETVTAFDT